MGKYLNSYHDLESLRKKKKNIVLAHGVFDLFHLGHLRHLKICKNFGDTLVVSITDDKFVKKGPNRPVFNSLNRAEIINSIGFVDYVFINKTETSEKVIQYLKPNVYIKGKDYKDLKKDITGNILKEKRLTEKYKGKLIFTDEVTFSSSNLINNHFFNENYTKNIKNLDINLVKNIFKETGKLKVAVIGELILDEYCFTNYLGSASKEEIVVMDYIKNDIFLGGAYALSKNISDFVDKVDFYSAGKLDKKVQNELKKDSKKNKVNLKFFKDDYRIIKKTRFLSQKNQKLFEIYNSSSNKKFFSNSKFNKMISSKIKNYDLVIVNDFGHGLISNQLADILQKKSKYLCVNTQTNAENRGFNLITKYKKIDLICLDLPELQLSISKKTDEKNMILEIFKKIKFKYFVLTLSKKGILIAKNENSKIKFFHKEAFELSPIDTIGAGDVVFGISSILSKIKTDINVNAFISNIFGALKVKILGHKKRINKEDVLNSINYMIK